MRSNDFSCFNNTWPVIILLMFYNEFPKIDEDPVVLTTHIWAYVISGQRSGSHGCRSILQSYRRVSLYAQWALESGRRPQKGSSGKGSVLYSVAPCLRDDVASLLSDNRSPAPPSLPKAPDLGNRTHDMRVAAILTCTYALLPSLYLWRQCIASKI